MAELEIHHEHEGPPDPWGQRIGVLTSVLAVLLAITTIASHRAHTKGVLVKADANDKWSYYQAKRIKLHNLELGLDLLGATTAKDPDGPSKIQRYEKERKRYLRESEEVQTDAKGLDHEVEQIEERALRYDFGEGLIEIALVLSSLYFISKKKYFPAIGVLAGGLGALVALSGLLLA